MEQPLVKLEGRKITVLYQSLFYMALGISLIFFIIKFDKNEYMNNYVVYILSFLALSSFILVLYLIYIAYLYSIYYYDDYFIIKKANKKNVIKLDDILETRIKRVGDYYKITYFLSNDETYTIKSFDYAHFNKKFKEVDNIYQLGWYLY